MMPTFLTSTSGSAADESGGGARNAAPHLILVGISGAGKSTAGRAAAALLGRPFLDLDAEIERREHSTVGELFAARGEPWFRASERALTEELKNASGFLLSPGGGWVANPGCVELLCPPATRIYLKVRPEAALARMAGAEGVGQLAETQKLFDAGEPIPTYGIVNMPQRNAFEELICELEGGHRALLQRPNPLAELERILALREPLYLQSNHTVSTELMSFDQVVQRIVALAGGSRPD